jgi:hypothetical protein
MKFLCFDIGIHNFSFIIADIDKAENSFDLKYIENKDLLPNVNVNKLSLDQSFFKLFHSYLKTMHDLFANCDYCLIEKQLLSKKNFKACKVYEQLYAHLCIFFPKIKLVSFPSKNKYFDHSYHKMNYKDRKNWAIHYICLQLENQKDDVMIDWLNCFKKKDDICDCILILLSYSLKHNLLTKDCLWTS